MSRIVAGVARGRRLATPPGRDTRPTPDRVREALFASLLADVAAFDGLAFLDLYAGSGAVGLEAASRGAAQVLLVEANARTAAVIRANVAAVGADTAAVRVAKVERLARTPADHAYDLAFLDPPYACADDHLAAVLADLLRNGWLAADALVVVERAARGPTFAWPAGFAADRSRRYGDTMLWYGRAAADAADAADGPRPADDDSPEDVAPPAQRPTTW